MAIVLAVFLGISVYIVPDYGMNVDAARNYSEGKANLDFLLTGQADHAILKHQTQGAFFWMMADMAKRIFHDGLGWYDPLAARHIIQPFLLSAFLISLFYFVRRHWGAWQGLVSVGLLLTFPSFFGHTFTNQKDLPLLIFFCLSLMSFVEWVGTHKLKYLYGFFILWGFALSIKFYAFLIPVLLLLWFLLRPGFAMDIGKPPWRASIVHMMAGGAITAAIVMSFYMPAIWDLPEKASFLFRWRSEVGDLVVKSEKPFNITSFIQIFFRTPFPVLCFALAGIIQAVKHYRENGLYTLLLLWLFVPVLLPCFPGTTPYTNGLRLFLVFLIPWTLFASLGIFSVAGFLAGKIRMKQRILAGGFAGLAIGSSLLGIILTHPYETTFFNVLAGGLGGAQEKKLPDACDYWLTSYLAAGRWINQNAANNAVVLGLGFVASGHFTPSITRKDLQVVSLYYLPLNRDGIAVPSNTYVIHAPNTVRAPQQSLMLEQSGALSRVHRVTRQGGEIVSIYYKP